MPGSLTDFWGCSFHFLWLNCRITYFTLLSDFIFHPSLFFRKEQFMSKFQCGIDFRLYCSLSPFRKYNPGSSTQSLLALQRGRENSRAPAIKTNRQIFYSNSTSSSWVTPKEYFSVCEDVNEGCVCLFVFLETLLFRSSSSSSTFQAAELAAVTSCNPKENCLCLWPGWTCWQWYVPGQGQPFHTAQHGRAATPSHF